MDDGGDLDFEGRSSFEASSGGEVDIEDDLSGANGTDPNGFGGDGGMGEWAMSMGQQSQQLQAPQHPQNMASAGDAGIWQSNGGHLGYGGQ